MKIAVACDGLSVAPLFLKCTSYMCYTVERGVIVDSRNLPAFDQPIEAAANVLRSLGVDVLIMGRIDPDAKERLGASGATLVTGAKGDPLQAARSYLASMFSFSGADGEDD